MIGIPGRGGQGSSGGESVSSKECFLLSKESLSGLGAGRGTRGFTLDTKDQQKKVFRI
mgnify:CR=1 FL=1